MQAMKSLMLKAVMVLTVSGSLLAVPVMAGTASEVLTGKACEDYIKKTGGTLSGCTSGEAVDKKDGYFSSFANTLISVAAIVSTLFLLIGAAQYITADGNAGRIEQAKLTVLYSVIGLTVAILARPIVGFVIQRTG